MTPWRSCASLIAPATRFYGMFHAFKTNLESGKANDYTLTSY